MLHLASGVRAPRPAAFSGHRLPSCSTNPIKIYTTRLADQSPPRSTAPTTLETADAIFKARRIPLLASGVVALGLGIYFSFLASSLCSSSCHEDPGPAPDAVPTGRPNVFTKDSARKFDQSLDGSEWLSGITSLRQRLAAEASGHVLEVAMGTGRNLSFFDWRDVLNPRTNSTAPALAAPKANALSPKTDVATMISYTGIDISSEMLGVAVEKLAEVVPELARLEPRSEKQTISSHAECSSISYLSGRLRMFRSDIHEYIPSPPQQSPTQPKYDFVCSTFSLCSVRDPEQMVRDLASKVKPNTGKIILVEHGRGWWGFVNGLLDKSAASHFQTWDDFVD
ncbi:methyltransferase OMS1 [Colletotrichum orchidophilum]|uniref:Methyltransferase OMS1 n=1 Tax=Colletotrichum orchidophilum TaxID=1209926 RepID=A0A1G4AZI5_9PEZI|nr:methyltransferase OMS1 [Colletotrichum orchidophilum]OHE94541.1 methyltransferase OMS1 [Colletotrichum orchidophilum]